MNDISHIFFTRTSRVPENTEQVLEALGEVAKRTVVAVEVGQEGVCHCGGAVHLDAGWLRTDGPLEVVPQPGAARAQRPLVGGQQAAVGALQEHVHPAGLAAQLRQAAAAIAAIAAADGIAGSGPGDRLRRRLLAGAAGAVVHPQCAPHLEVRREN